VLLTVLTASAAEFPPDPPAELLARIAAIRQNAKRFGNEMWPAWDPTATPLAVHKRGELGVLVGHPKPPAGFQPYSTAAIAEPVFVAPNTQGMTLSSTAAPFAGTLTSFVGFNSIMDLKDTEDAVALGMHELFHAHEGKIAPRKVGNILVFLWGQYPEFSARNRVMLQLEAEALYRAVKAADAAETRRHAADFLDLRLERRKEIAADAAGFESGEESSEGLAHYIEYRVLELAYPQRTDLREKRLEALKQTGGLARARDRFYTTGMAIALLLDRLRPGWKQEYETTPALIDQLLAKSVPPQSTPRDLAALILDERQRLDKRSDEGSRRLGLMLNSGYKVVVEVGEAKKQLRLRGFDPYGAVQLTPDHIAHTFLLLDMPGMKLEFTGVPVIYEKLQDALWCMLPEEVVLAAIKKMGEKLVLQGPGYLLEFEKMEAAQRGRELRIKPATDLQRKQGTGKPEILKIEKR